VPHLLNSREVPNREVKLILSNGNKEAKVYNVDEKMLEDVKELIWVTAEKLIASSNPVTTVHTAAARIVLIGNNLTKATFSGRRAPEGYSWGILSSDKTLEVTFVLKVRKLGLGR